MKNFNIRLLIQLCLLFLTMAALAYILTDDRLFFSKIILFAFLVIQVAALLYFLNYSFRQMEAMVAALKNRDFSLRFPKKGYGKSMDKLLNTLNRTIQDIENEHIEKEGKLQYLTLAFEQIEAGIISVKNGKELILVNSKAQQLLKIPEVHHWDLLRKHQPDFFHAIEQVPEGGDIVITIRQENQEYDLSVSVTKMKMLNNDFTHITFKDIHDELDRKEFQAWQKLIRILTHEIMNSVTPVSSLAENMENMLDRVDQTETNIQEFRDDLIFSAKTIRRRSDGLLEFVENYRNLTRIPEPRTRKESIDSLTDDIIRLYGDNQNNFSIVRELQLHEITFDRILVEQILMNLIKNSVEALTSKDNGLIKISSFQEKDWNCISVEDNGEGIDEDELKEIFVPFFTTKKSGSGIGLSLSKQIMIAHGGRILVTSKQHEGTNVTLKFPR